MYINFRESIFPENYGSKFFFLNISECYCMQENIVKHNFIISGKQCYVWFLTRQLGNKISAFKVTNRKRKI